MQVFDIETGFADVKLNLNPEGWIPGVTKEKDWLVRLAPGHILGSSRVWAGCRNGCAQAPYMVAEVRRGAPIAVRAHAVRPACTIYCVNECGVVCAQMCHGLDVSPHDGTVVAGDNRGRLHFLDPRQEKPFAAAAVHKKDKVCNGAHIALRAAWLSGVDGQHGNYKVSSQGICKRCLLNIEAF